MPLENAQFITGINPAWPEGTEQVAEGDNQIRDSIKFPLVNSFPTVDQQILKAVGDEDATDDTQQYLWTPKALNDYVASIIDSIYQPPVLGSSVAVSKTADQVFANNSPAKVVFEQVDWNDEGWDAAGNRHLPQIAGRYLYLSSLSIDPDGSSPRKQVYLEVRKNGMIEKRSVLLHPGGGENSQISISTLVDMNGSTDYVSIWFTHLISGNEQIVGDPTRSYMQVVQVSQA